VTRRPGHGPRDRRGRAAGRRTAAAGDPARTADVTAARVIVGLAGWQDGKLRHVYVDPAYTRRGIATGLLSHVEADFRTRTGATRIEAGVALNAEPFYRARGYQLVRRAQDWDGSAYLEMIKSL
jgi:GNAT superfamily N-acetyltransferase